MDLRSIKKQKVASSTSDSLSDSTSDSSTESVTGPAVSEGDTDVAIWTTRYSKRCQYSAEADQQLQGSPQQQPTDKADGREISVPCNYKMKGVATNIDKLGYGRWRCILCGSNQVKRLPQCDHCICDECIMPFITNMIRSGAFGFKCLKRGCTVMWTADQCMDYLPREVAVRLTDVIREATVLANPRYLFCPSPKCGALIIDDLKADFIIVCTKCWALFCMRCRVDWHEGMSCSQYQALVRAADQCFS